MKQATPLKDGKMDLEATPFLATQPKAKDDGFKNVSKIWLATTISFDEGIEKLSKGRAETEDINLPMDAVSFGEKDGKLVVDLDGNKVAPTEHALRQLGSRLDIPTKILTNWYEGDIEDVDTVIMILENGKRKYLAGEVAKKVDDEDAESQKFLWRTRKDGTLRATLSNKFARMDNAWFLSALKKIMPEGRLSHWDKADSDTIYGNILIPDSLRVESDSSYGGGVSVGNSEIGVRALSSNPWLYKFICQNGCIWDKIKGVSYSRKHLGVKIDYEEQFNKLSECINKQIPLVPAHIDAMMETKNWAFTGVVKRLIAQTAADLILNKKQATLILEAYEVEPELSCFGLINAITRASQKMDGETWVAMDIYAAKLIDASFWATYVTKTNAMTSKDVESYFVTVTA